MESNSLIDISKLNPELAATISKLDATERALVIARYEQKLARTDLMYLANDVLGYDFVPEVHQELFDCFMQYDTTKPWAQQSDKVKRLILWPRGHYKTVAVQVVIINTILNFPDIRILLMQFGLKNTKKLMNTIMAHFLGTAHGSRLRELFPEFCPKKAGNKKELEATPESFTVPARQKKQLPQATVTCASAKSGKTGQHYDIAFIDDLICDQNYLSEDQLAKAEEEFYMAMPLLDPPFYCVVTGTRYAHGDLYEKIIRADEKDKKWVISVKTCWSDDGKQVRFPQYKTRDGRLMGLTREMLLEIQATKPEMYCSQYLNQPASTARQLFTEQMLLEACVAPDSVPDLGATYLFVDCATTNNEKSDDCVIVAGRVDSRGCMYAVDCVGGQWLPEVFTRQVVAMTLKHRPVKVCVEKTHSGSYMEALVRIIAQQYGIVIPIELISGGTQKDAKKTRIAGLRAYILARKLRFFVGLPAWHKIVEQFLIFDPAASIRHQHNDYPDTIALMVMEFSKSIVQMPLGMNRPKQSIVQALMEQHEQEQRSVLRPDKEERSWDSDFAF